MEYNRILVDTSIFIEFLRKKNKSQTELFNIPDRTIIYISTVTLFELFAGATNTQKWNDIKELTEDLTIIPFSQEIAQNAASIFLELKKKNKLIEFRDIFIAATAITNQMPIKTLNKKHFNRIANLIVVS